MFNETSYNRACGLSDVMINPSEDYKTYKARGGTLSKVDYQLSVGRGSGLSTQPVKTQPTLTPAPVIPGEGTITAPGLQAPAPAAGSSPASDSGGGFDLGGIFSGIPQSYLLIGGAVLLFFMMKKR